MDIKKLESYAELIVRVGANVQKGQDVVISAELDQPEFVEMLVEQCYLAGAAEVRVEWTHQPLRLKHVKYQTVERLGEIKDWEKQKLLNRAETLPAMIYIESADPSGLDGLDQEKWGKSVQMRWKVIKPIRDSMENKYQWVIAAAPGKAWAKKVFPELGEAEAVEKLWEAILYTSRAEGDGFANCIKDFENYTLEQCREMGINSSMIHEDFMIGSEDLNITGETESGERVQIFKNGNWAF